MMPERGNPSFYGKPAAGGGRRLFGLFCLWLLAASPASTTALDGEIREAIYRAEVLGEVEAALETLRAMLAGEIEPPRRAAVVDAMAVTKQSLPRLKGPSEPSLVAEKATGFLSHRGNAFILALGRWWELGDWLGDAYLAEVHPAALVLAKPNGTRYTLAMPRLEGISPVPEEGADACLLANARVGDVLEFITKREGLSSFFPSSFQKRISGTFPVADWQEFMDRICKEAGIRWTRRRDNVVFRKGPYADNAPFPRINLDRKNQSLITFLQNLAEDMKLELVLDEDLGDISVDVHLQDQAWDEVLDCLSIMNGFNWSLVRDGGDPPKLFIQKE